MDHELMIFTNAASPPNATLGELRRIHERIELGDGVSLGPPLIRTAGAIGSLDVVSLLFNVPLGIAVHLAATRLHEWMARHNIRRVRVNGVEVQVSGQAEEVVTAIAQLLESRLDDRKPQPSDVRPGSTPA